MSKFDFAGQVINYQVIVIVHGESLYLSLHAQRLPLQLKEPFQLPNCLAVTHIAAPKLCHLCARCTQMQGMQGMQGMTHTMEAK